jgi:hypothetical protein
VSSLSDIQRELDEATARRSQLWEDLSLGRDADKTSEIDALSRRIEALYSELRAAKAYIRSGDPKRIIARARAEERFDREERRIRRIAA